MRNLAKGLIWIISFLLLGMQPVFAEDISLEKIVVTPSRNEASYKTVSQKVDVITAKEIETAAASNPSEALEQISSVNIKDYGGPGAKKIINIRGSTEKQVLVMMDGRPLTNAHSGDIDLSTIPVENIEKIEVVHGPASGLYGSSAMGGVVNIITKNPPRKGFKTTLYSGFGTFRTYTERLTHGGNLNKFGYLLTGDYKTSEGFRGHSESSAKDASIKMSYEFSDDNRLAFNSGFSRTDTESPGPKTNNTLDDYQKWLKSFLDLTWKTKIWDKLGIILKTYENHDRLEFTSRPIPLIRSVHVTKTRGQDLQFDYQFAKFYKFLFGFNYAGNFDDSSVTGKHKYNVRSGFLQNQLELFNRLHVDFGGRIDDYSNFGTEVTPNIGLTYEIDEKTRIRILHGRSFRAPTFSDLYWDETSYKGNPNLRPERGKSYEFGIEREFLDKLTLDLTYFRNDFKNLIKWQLGGDSVWRPQNINKANIQGLEFNGKLALNKNFDVNLEYTYQRPMNRVLHKDLPDQPRYKVNTTFGYHDNNGLRLCLKWEFTDRKFSNETNTLYVKRHFLLGLDASKKLNQRTTLFVSIDNLTNRTYEVVSGYPMPGFSIDAGLKFDL